MIVNPLINIVLTFQLIKLKIIEYTTYNSVIASSFFPSLSYFATCWTCLG